MLIEQCNWFYTNIMKYLNSELNCEWCNRIGVQFETRNTPRMHEFRVQLLERRSNAVEFIASWTLAINTPFTVLLCLRYRWNIKNWFYFCLILQPWRGIYRHTFRADSRLPAIRQVQPPVAHRCIHEPVSILFHK